MNATRILPDLQCSLLCEDVRPEANGNFILVGVIGWIRVPQVPVRRRARAVDGVHHILNAYRHGQIEHAGTCA